MEEKLSNKKHTINLTDRERLSITGVTEVFSFDEELIELATSKGYIDIKGEGLHIIKMNIDDGEVSVEGMITDLLYHDSQGPGRKKSALMSKLFK